MGYIIPLLLYLEAVGLSLQVVLGNPVQVAEAVPVGQVKPA